MPVESLLDLKLYVNPAKAKDMGVKVPESVTKRADEIIK
jgi:putative ABC transport system substrate-binding protein